VLAEIAPESKVPILEGVVYKTKGVFIKVFVKSKSGIKKLEFLLRARDRFTSKEAHTHINFVAFYNRGCVSLRHGAPG